MRLAVPEAAVNIPADSRFRLSQVSQKKDVFQYTRSLA